jgi:hypothetical protein
MSNVKYNTKSLNDPEYDVKNWIDVDIMRKIEFQLKLNTQN